MKEKLITEKMIPGLRKLAEAEIQVRAHVNSQEDIGTKLPPPVGARIAVIPSIRERSPYFVR